MELADPGVDARRGIGGVGAHRGIRRVRVVDRSVGAHRGIGRVRVVDAGLGATHATEAVSLVSLGSGEPELVDPDGASLGS